ncbi:MAG: hypothetical protein ACFN3A_00145 [Candidatus Nanosyncoccus sp.]|jgi:hypothetical protein
MADTITTKKTKSKTKDLTINQKLEQLDQQIEWFYGDKFSLEEATQRYQEAAASAKEIEANLNEIKNQIEIIDHDFSKE